MDLIACEYKWDLNKILDLTLKEVFIFTKKITKRNNDENNLQARLHGFKIKNDIEPIEFNEKTNSIVEKDYKEQFKKNFQERLNAKHN